MKEKRERVSAEQSSSWEPSAGSVHHVYIGFGKDKGLKGRFICGTSDAEFSHSWVEYYSGVWGNRWVCHATKRGVIKEFHEHVYDRYPKRVLYRCDLDLKDGIEKVRGRVGRSNYDFGGILNLCILWLFRKTGWKFWNRFVVYDKTRVTCSELVAEMLDYAGVKNKKKEIVPDITTTGDLVELVANCEKFRFVEPSDLPG